MQFEEVGKLERWQNDEISKLLLVETAIVAALKKTIVV
jgi:hypothetical protein